MPEGAEEGSATQPASGPSAISGGKVFISYASQDVATADAVVDTLERHGVFCWVAPRDVKAGALYADAIVRAISGAPALVLVLSEHAVASSHVSKEIERASSKRRPIIALRIDGAPLSPALEYFLSESQWVDARAGGVDAALAKLIGAIRDSPNPPPIKPPLDGTSAVKAPAVSTGGRHNRLLVIAISAAAAVVLAGLMAGRLWISQHSGMSQPATSVAPDTSAPVDTPKPVAASAPPAHSIAVLPFVNISGDKEQQYFSDGLTEELLNSLSRVTELQVAARTSSFSFQGEHPDIVTVARKLNVAAVLEGSVRRSAHTVRITAQLVNGVTGFHLWSQTYDRDLGDVLALQTDIANAVSNALKVTLLGDVAARVELGGTRDPAAFDAYLRGSRAGNGTREGKEAQIKEFTEAVRLDPNYALAFAARSAAYAGYAGYWASGVAGVREATGKALADAHKAILLAPDLAEGHLALADVLASSLELMRANDEYERAVALAPGNAKVLRIYGSFAVAMGRTDHGVAAVRRAVVLDPLNPVSHNLLGDTLAVARRYDEAITAFQDSLALDPSNLFAYVDRGLTQYLLGDFQGARSSCEAKAGEFALYRVCLAISYDKLGRHADAEAMLAKAKASFGEADAYEYARIYAQWGNPAKALEWFETAVRLRHGDLPWLRVDPLLDPLRKEPRFQAIERALKFPPP
jgi:TolB-like protein